MRNSIYSITCGPSSDNRSADFPVRRKLLSHNRAANWVQVGVRTMLRTGKSALRDLRPRSLTGYCVSPLEVDRAHVVLYLPPRFDGSVQSRTLSCVATASSAGRSPAICPAGLVGAA